MNATCRLFFEQRKVLEPFLTQGTSEGRKVSHCYQSRCCNDEPTWSARVVQFEFVAVAMQPRFHYIQHLNEVTV